MRACSLVDRAGLSAHRSAVRGHQLRAQPTHQEDAEDDRRRDDGAGGFDHRSLRNIELVKRLGLAHQEVVRLNGITDKILQTRAQESALPAQPELYSGNRRQPLRTGIHVPDALSDFHGSDHDRASSSLCFYSFYIFSPLQELGNVINAYRETEASMQSLQEMLDIPPEPKPVDAQALGNLGSLEFDSVRFQHRTASRPASCNVSFQLSRGETVAFVGPSGAGKTTLVKLLVGLYHAKEGAVRYNGIDARHIDPGGTALANRFRHARYAVVLGFYSRESALRPVRGHR